MKRRKTLFIARSLLMPGVCVSVGGAIACDLVNYDDVIYIYYDIYHEANARDGLTRHGLPWAFTCPHAGNRHPRLPPTS